MGKIDRRENVDWKSRVRFLALARVAECSTTCQRLATPTLCASLAHEQDFPVIEHLV